LLFQTCIKKKGITQVINNISTLARTVEQRSSWRGPTISGRSALSGFKDNTVLPGSTGPTSPASSSGNVAATAKKWEIRSRGPLSVSDLERQLAELTSKLPNEKEKLEKEKFEREAVKLVTKSCPNCGFSNHISSAFCINCGSRVSTAIANATGTASSTEVNAYATRIRELENAIAELKGKLDTNGGDTGAALTTAQIDISEQGQVLRRAWSIYFKKWKLGLIIVILFFLLLTFYLLQR